METESKTRGSSARRACRACSRRRPISGSRSRRPLQVARTREGDDQLAAGPHHAAELQRRGEARTPRARGPRRSPPEAGSGFQRRRRRTSKIGVPPGRVGAAAALERSKPTAHSGPGRSPAQAPGDRGEVVAGAGADLGNHPCRRVPGGDRGTGDRLGDPLVVPRAEELGSSLDHRRRVADTRPPPARASEIEVARAGAVEGVAFRAVGAAIRVGQ